MILVTCAVGAELAFFRPQSGVEMLVCGIGVVEASAAVSRALAQSRYDLIVSAGIAGAISESLDVGDAVVVSEDRLDLALETGAPLELPEGASVIDRVSSDLTLVDRLVEAGFRSVRGLTVTQVTALEATAARLRAAGAEVESMEGFAVLRAAEIAGVAAIEVRGISNLVRARALSRWDFAAGVRGLERVLTSLLSLTGRTDV